MKTLTKYEAVDGTLFDREVDAFSRDLLVARCDVIAMMLPPPVDDSGERIQHDPTTLAAYRFAVVALCRELYPNEKIFTRELAEIHPFGWAGRFLSDVAPSCVNRLWHRLMCCANGYEYQQPYFALHPDEWRSKATATENENA